MLRYCIPRVRRRGYGLGNEFLPWGRAFIAAQVLNAKLLPPAFGMNRRAYWRHFGTAPDDWIYNRAIERVFPVVEFAEADYLAHGGGDVVAALRSFAAAHKLYDRRVYALVTDGTWGGFHHIAAAREFIRATLQHSRYAARNLQRLRDRLDPHKVTVAMHVRLGDFIAPTVLTAWQRVPGASLPIEWFCNIASSLQEALGRDWQLLLVSDGEPAQLKELTERFSYIITADLPHGDCSDALALASADLLVCSASTYSSLAAFLSDSPYLWFAPNLVAHSEGCYSFHGVVQGPGHEHDPIRVAVADFVNQPTPPRGIALDLNGRVPAVVVETAVKRRDARRWQSDLVRGGVTPIVPPP